MSLLDDLPQTLEDADRLLGEVPQAFEQVFDRDTVRSLLAHAMIAARRETVSDVIELLGHIDTADDARVKPGEAAYNMGLDAARKSLAAILETEMPRLPPEPEASTTPQGTT